MIHYIDAWLDRWAEWHRRGNGPRLGYSSTSAEYKMMTTNRAVATAANAQRRRHWLAMGKGKGVRLVPRNLEPMRCVERRGKAMPESVSDDPEAEAMEEAIMHLRESLHRDVARLKYRCEWDNKTAASIMGISVATYKANVNLLHGCLDAYLRAKHPRMAVELEKIHR